MAHNTPAFKTKRGRLTRYALACGYIERDGIFTLSMQHTVLLVTGRTAAGEYVSRGYPTLQGARIGLRTLANLYSVPRDGGLRVSPPAETKGA